jgi:hypothetical protein
MLAFICLAVMAAAILTYNTILALIVIGLAATSLVLLTIEWVKESRRSNSRSALLWPGYVLDGFRLLAGTGAIVVSQTAIVTSKESPDPALRWAVFLLGVFVLFHVLIGEIVVRLPARAGGDEDEQVPNPFDIVAPVLVTTPGVVLGLLAVFEKVGAMPTVVKVAAVSLATALLLGIVLNGLVSMHNIDDPPRSTVIRLMFNLAFWALALGVLGVAMGIVYRT